LVVERSFNVVPIKKDILFHGSIYSLVNCNKINWTQKITNVLPPSNINHIRQYYKIKDQQLSEYQCLHTITKNIKQKLWHGNSLYLRVHSRHLSWLVSTWRVWESYEAWRVGLERTQDKSVQAGEADQHKGGHLIQKHYSFTIGSAPNGWFNTNNVPIHMCNFFSKLFSAVLKLWENL